MDSTNLQEQLKAMSESFRISEITLAIQLRMVFPLMKELRPHLSFSEFCSLYRLARKTDHYSIAAVFDESHRCIGAMGYRVLYDLAHGKHLYIDDLVTHASSPLMRDELLKYASQRAADEGCSRVSLAPTVSVQPL